jgi:hypothetical protein
VRRLPFPVPALVPRADSAPLVPLPLARLAATVGYAKQYSGVSTSSFLKHFTSQELSPAGLKNLGPYVEILADVEQLGAHKASVSLRLDKIAREGL